MNRLVDSLRQLLLIGGIELVLDLVVVECVAQVVCVRLETVLGGDASSSGLILSYRRNKSVTG